MLSDALAWITTHPVGVALLLLLLGAVVYFALQKLLKLALILLLGFLVLSAYYTYTGEEPPDGLKKLKEDASRHLEDGVNKGREKAKEVGEALGEEIKKGAQESLEKALKLDGDGTSD